MQYIFLILIKTFKKSESADQLRPTSRLRLYTLSKYSMNSYSNTLENILKSNQRNLSIQTNNQKF